MKGIIFYWNKIYSLQATIPKAKLYQFDLQKREESSKQMIHQGHYKLTEILGAGSFGKVYLASDHHNQQFAIKKIKKQTILNHQKAWQSLKSEINTMKDFDSPYLMKYLGGFDDQKYIYFVLEYCNGGTLKNLQHNKQKGKIFPLQKATQLLADVIKGMLELHKKKYLHRDLKPQNILIKTVNGKNTYKLGDFGFSKKLESCSNTTCGSLYFMSPQIFSGKKYGQQVDMWSFGVTFYLMLNNDLPFKKFPKKTQNLCLRNYEYLMEVAKDFSYKQSVLKSNKKHKYNCSDQVEDLFKKMFDLNPEQRITFSQIRFHPLFSRYFPEDNEGQSTNSNIHQQN